MLKEFFSDNFFDKENGEGFFKDFIFSLSSRVITLFFLKRLIFIIAFKFSSLEDINYS